MLKYWAFPLVSALALLFVLGGSAPAGASVFVDPYPRQSGYDCMESSPPPTGMPAIQPHLHAIPAFTADDVRRYFQANDAQSATDSVIVLKILFTSNQEVCERTRGESTGLDDNAPVCFVELRGMFYPRSYPRGFHPQPSPYAYEVFDAQTGNLLMFDG